VSPVKYELSFISQKTAFFSYGTVPTFIFPLLMWTVAYRVERQMEDRSVSEDLWRM
jgi:hypothetical protein